LATASIQSGKHLYGHDQGLKKGIFCMRTRFISLSGAIILSTVAFLTLMARLTFLDALYVPEFRTMLPENQPVTIGMMMLVYMAASGGWIWSLVAAARGSRAGLVVSLIFCLFTAIGGGLLTLTALCPAGCAAPPVGNIIVWANLISGLAASIALGFQLTRQQSSVVQSEIGGEAA
jgi:hypothetical protein